MPQPELTLTPISEWVSHYELVALPSGRVAGLRQPDVIELLLEDGRLPNILMPLLARYMAPQVKSQETDTITPESLAELSRLLDRVARACFVVPAIVEDDAAVVRGEGIRTHHITFEDKSFLMQWAMGGRAAVEAAQRFRQIESERLRIAPSDAGSGDATEPVAGHPVGVAGGPG